jgi:hypothetical protein
MQGKVAGGRAVFQKGARLGQGPGQLGPGPIGEFPPISVGGAHSSCLEPVPIGHAAKEQRRIVRLCGDHICMYGVETLRGPHLSRAITEEFLGWENVEELERLHLTVIYTCAGSHLEVILTPSEPALLARIRVAAMHYFDVTPRMLHVMRGQGIVSQILDRHNDASGKPASDD